MTRRSTHWLLTLPVVLAGIEAAHARERRGRCAGFGGVRERRLGPGALQPLGLLLLAAVVAGLVARIRGGASQPRDAAVVAVPFALLPPVGFTLLELGEALASGHALLDRTFALGLAFQLPVALLGYLLARGLLRLGDELRALVLASPRLCLPPPGGLVRPVGAAGLPSPRRRHLPRACAALRARPHELTPVQASAANRRSEEGISMRSARLVAGGVVAGAVVVLAVALAVAAFLFQSDTTAAARRWRE